MIIDRKSLTDVLGVLKPRNLKFYQEVFIHKSALKRVNQNSEIKFKSNERLEFLGDVVLSLAVTDYLYLKYTNENEGFLTKLRIKLVKGSTLTKFATRLNIEKHVLTSTNTVVNEHILENVFEALIGALYLDYKQIGIEMIAVRKFVFHILDTHVDWNDVLIDDNYKDILMRYAQKKHLQLPHYSVLKSSIPNRFNVRLQMKDCNQVSMSVSKHACSKKDAEQECAKEMLEKMNCSKIHFINSNMNEFSI